MRPCGLLAFVHRVLMADEPTPEEAATDAAAAPRALHPGGEFITGRGEGRDVQVRSFSGFFLFR
jgi:hypothetical protein